MKSVEVFLNPTEINRFNSIWEKKAYEISQFFLYFGNMEGELH